MPDDQFQLGQLTAQLAALNYRLAAMEGELHNVKASVDEITKGYMRGKSFVFGALVVIGFALFGAKELFIRLVTKFA